MFSKRLTIWSMCRTPFELPDITPNPGMNDKGLASLRPSLVNIFGPTSVAVARTEHMRNIELADVFRHVLLNLESPVKRP